MDRSGSHSPAGASSEKGPPARKPLRRPRVPGGAIKENPRLAALKRKHFTKKGRASRIARALKALEQFTWDFSLDDATLKWIAEDPNIEHF